jgi:hypothetical protein
VVGRFVPTELVDALAQLVACAPEVATLDVQQPSRDLDEALVELAVIVG